MKRLSCMLVLGCAACGHTGQTREPEPTTQTAGASPAQPSQAPVVGHWVRDLPNGEHYLLHLFPSGIVGFQHVGPELPISMSYGRWTASGDELSLTIVGDEPAQRAFPLAKQFTASVDSGALTLVANGERTTWSVHDTYGVSRAGWEERAAKDERDWTAGVERSEKQAPTAP